MFLKSVPRLSPLRLKESFAALNEWDTKNPGNPDIVETKENHISQTLA